MGHTMRYECQKCEVSRIEHVGFGMLGIGSELCACYHCHRYVLKKMKWSGTFEEEVFSCPYCRKTIQRINHGDNCPICTSPIEAELIALWD